MRLADTYGSEDIDSEALDEELARIVAVVAEAKRKACSVYSESSDGTTPLRIPVGRRVWAVYHGDRQWYEGVVTKVMSRKRYMVKFDGYDGDELCSEIEEQPDPEKEKQLILDIPKLCAA